MQPLPSLPEPEEVALRHSRALAELIQKEITAAGGWISFERYMRLALYAPASGITAEVRPNLAEGEISSLRRKYPPCTAEPWRGRAHRCSNSPAAIFWSLGQALVNWPLIYCLSWKNWTACQRGISFLKSVQSCNSDNVSYLKGAHTISCPGLPGWNICRNISMDG